jgi:uncharacterized zinc-type alcohol dehydrogenase-like protein
MSASTVLGYAAMKVGRELEPLEFTPPDLGELDVRVDISHCGVCYTDVHGIQNDYGISTFPFVPGHEIVGTVTEVGPSVSELKVGDRVGIGWQGRSCMQCEWCLRGEEHLCDDIENCGTWKPYGGFSASIVVDGRFVYPLPEAMPSETAAVLMCAGVSVYAPLRRFEAGPSMRIGVIGIGGLGHIAIQFAHAMGCEVTAISSSPEKEEEALQFGADAFVQADKPDALKPLMFSFDLLLYTAHGKREWTDLVNSLKARGRMIVLGFPEGPVTFDPMELVVREMSIIGSLVGSRAAMREMLPFAQEHRITPKVELMPMSQVNEALRRIKENKARYRIVLERDS